MRVLFVILLVFSSNAIALSPAVTTKCMVAKADAIVVAKFTSGSKRPIYKDRLGDLYLANFDNLGTFKGFGIEMIEFKKYSLLLRRGNAEDPKFLSGGTYLLYLKYSEIGPYILSGSRGAVKIDKESLREVKDVQKFIKESAKIGC